MIELLLAKKSHSKTNKTENPVINWESIWAHFYGEAQNSKNDITVSCPITYTK